MTRHAEFRLAAIVPIAAGDRDMAPTYPGITDSPTLDDWDPPFPLDLRRVRPLDEEYWKMYRTTPKAFIPLEVGQDLWRSRYGALTSIRIVPPAGEPLADAAAGARSRRARRTSIRSPSGLAVRDVRADALAASRGATDFGEYFVYFSFFLVVSALLLAALFFKLGVEQRAREVGLLRAVGFRAGDRSTAVPGEGWCSPRRQRPRRGRRDRIRVAADGRPSHLVGGRRGHHGAVAARDAGVARRRVPSAASSRRSPAPGGRCAASTRSRSGACLPAQLSVQRRT